MKQIFFQVIFTMVLLWYSILFLRGYWHEENKGKFCFFRRHSIVIDPDLLFGNLDVNKGVVLSADILAFWICVTMSFCVVFDGVLAFFINGFPDKTVFFVFIGLLLVWFFRFIFILIFKNKPTEKIPKFWPYKRL